MTKTTIFAREGGFVLGLLLVALALSLWFGLYIVSLFSFLSLLFFGRVFYNPERIAPEYSNTAILAPADGKISEVLLQEDSMLLRIEKPFFATSLLRAPLEGKFSVIGRNFGLLNGDSQSGSRIYAKFVADSKEFALSLFPRYKTKIYFGEDLEAQKTEIKSDIESTKKPSRSRAKNSANIAQNLVLNNSDSMFLAKASHFRQNDRIGFMAGGVVELELPKNVALKVAQGDRIYAGSTLLGTIQE